MKFSVALLVAALLAPGAALQAAPPAEQPVESVDLKFARSCAWSRGNDHWIEAGQCQIEGWQGSGELLLTVQWPSGQRSVIETSPAGGQARIDHRSAVFQPGADGTWMFHLPQGGALRFSPG